MGLSIRSGSRRHSCEIRYLRYVTGQLLALVFIQNFDFSRINPSIDLYLKFQDSGSFRSRRFVGLLIRSRVMRGLNGCPSLLCPFAYRLTERTLQFNSANAELVP